MNQKANLDTRDLDIGEVSKQTGLAVSTLRFYEERGLIQSIGRKGLRRIFSHNIIERLAFITLGTRAGFSLDEIAAMFTKDGKPRVNRRQLRKKAEDIGKEIKQLTAIQNSLIHAADCPESNQLECGKFRRLMYLALRQRRRQ